MRGSANGVLITMNFPRGQSRKSMSDWRRDIGHRFDGPKAKRSHRIAYLPGGPEVLRRFSDPAA